MALLSGLFLMPNAGMADTAMDEATSPIESAAEAAEYGFRAGSFVVAPIPFKNPVIGAGLALGLGYIYQTDEASNNSVIGVGAMASDNGTRAYGASVSMAWDDNRWQLSALLAEGDLNYDLYVGSIPLPVRQVGTVFSGSLLYGVTPELAFGGSFRLFDTRVTELSGATLPPGISDSLVVQLGSIGAVAKWDTRPDSFYPRHGHLLDVEIMRASAISGTPRDYTKGVANFGLYRSFSESTVFATQASFCAASNEAPFFDQCSLGGTDRFRGFPATQYYGFNLLSLQVELRQQLSERFRAVGFAGAGMVSDTPDGLDFDEAHLAAGAGLRFKLTRKFDADFSADVAYNDEGDTSVYIYVGQRF